MVKAEEVFTWFEGLSFVLVFWPTPSILVLKKLSYLESKGLKTSNIYLEKKSYPLIRECQDLRWMHLLDFQAGTSASLKNPCTGVQFSTVSIKASACKHILYKQFACLNSFHERASWTRGHQLSLAFRDKKITIQRALSTYPEAMVSFNKTCRPISTCCLLHVMKREVYEHKLLSLLPERSIFAALILMTVFLRQAKLLSSSQADSHRHCCCCSCIVSC